MLYPLSTITDIALPVVPTYIPSLDTVLGGGFVTGSSILFAGTTGSGKSTLLLQVANRIAKQNKRVLYVAGEESKEQIKIRANRLSISNPTIMLLEDTQIETVIQNIQEQKPDMVMLDSLQMLYSPTVKTAAGTPSQMRHALFTFCDIAKKQHITIIFVGHATKGGYIAGLQTFQHMVDVVLYLALNEDNSRTLKANKNRFGSIEYTIPLYMNEYGLSEQKNMRIPFGAQTIYTIPLTKKKNVLHSFITGFLTKRAQQYNLPVTDNKLILTDTMLSELTFTQPFMRPVIARAAKSYAETIF